MATKEATKYKEKGNEAFKAGDHAKAIEMYTYATELDPNNPVFYTNRSNAYFKMKNYAKSERDALKSVKADPSWAKGYYRLGLALQAQEKFKEAMEAFKQATDNDSKNKAFKDAFAACKRAMMKGMSDAEIFKTEGNEAFKSGHMEDAIKSYTKAIAKAQNTEKDQKIKADCLANRAAVYRQQYLPEKCIEDCTECLKIVPGHVKCLIRRAQAYESMEKYKAALADFQKATMLDPKCTLAMNSATRIRASLKKLGIQF